MAYTLQRFGAITLPLYNRRTDMSPVLPRTALLATAAGTFDAWGSERAPQKLPHNITMACVLSEDAAAAFRTAIDALRAAVGTRASLYRLADDDATVHRCTARLIDMDYQRAVANIHHQELKLTFQQLDAWTGRRAEDWVLDDGSDLDDGLYLDTGDVLITPPGASEVTILGNLPAKDVRITMNFDGVDTDPAYVVIPQSGVAIEIAGPWANLDVLYIDAEARTITLNGADCYSRVNLDNGYLAYDHTASEWLRLEPGYNQVFAIGTALDSATLQYVEAWA